MVSSWVCRWISVPSGVKHLGRHVKKRHQAFLAAMGKLGMLVERFDTGRDVVIVLVRGYADPLAHLHILGLASCSITGKLGIFGERVRAFLAVVVLHDELVVSQADNGPVKHVGRAFGLGDMGVMVGRGLVFIRGRHSYTLSLQGDRTL